MDKETVIGLQWLEASKSNDENAIAKVEGILACVPVLVQVEG